MDKYLFVFRGGMGTNLTPAEMQASMEKWGAWIGEMTKKGIYKGGDPLDDGGKVLVGKKKIVTDGPYAESKDLIGGYVIIEAASLDAAAELARGCPIFESDGSVEVRKIRPM
jgi:hypothetical protein